MIEKWQVSRIDDAKDIINHMVKDIGRINAISSTLSKEVEKYDGKCWNKKIETSLRKNIMPIYEYACIFGDYENGTFFVTGSFLGMNVPYDLQRVYVAEDKKLYTPAGNFRINAKEWQAYAKSYSQLCTGYVKKLEADKENLENIVSKYNELLDSLVHVAKSLQSETRDAIRKSYLFNSPIYRLF